VTDSLRRNWFIAQRTVSFDFVAVLAAVGCVVVLYVSWLNGRLNRRGVLAAVLLIPSACVHGLSFVVHLLFAG
jgi:hypothetical protein